jgi:CelD/BcsL family acetyltransferase involved in cellulose biosynthesis
MTASGGRMVFMFNSLSAVTELVSVNADISNGATLSVVTSLDALRQLQTKWHDLEKNTQNHASVFQSFDWVMTWAETYIADGKATSLHVIAGYDAEKLVFVWPLMRTTQMGLATLTWLTDPFGQYGDVMCRKGQNTRLWLESALNFMRRLRDVDILRLRHVRADSHLAAHAVDFLHDARVPDGAPFLDLTQYASEDAYDERYTSTQRKRRKKIRKALEELGPVTFERLPTGTTADVAIRDAIAEKNAWLSERGRINRVLGCPKHVTFLKNLSRRRSGTVEVVVTEMKAGNKPVSWEVGFRHRGTHYGYITSHVNALTDLSPGRLHMDQSQRDALGAGMTAFDLMVPNDTHKESWSSAVVVTNDYYLPISMAGAALGHGFIRTLRPLLRRAYYNMDASTLRRLNWKTMFKGKSSLDG